MQRYHYETVFSDIYGKWFHLNVIHDVSTHEIQIFINRKLALTTKDFGGDVWHFKCGVYGGLSVPGLKQEVFYRNIKIYHK